MEEIPSLKRVFVIGLLVFGGDIYSLESCDKQDAYTREKLEESFSVSRLIRHDQSLGPVRDQGPIGNCFAYVASDLLEHWLKSKGNLSQEQQLSPLGIALGYLGEEWEKKTVDFYGLYLMGREYLLSIAQPLRVKIESLRGRIEELKKRVEFLDDSISGLPIAKRTAELRKGEENLPHLFRARLIEATYLMRDKSLEAQAWLAENYPDLIPDFEEYNQLKSDLEHTENLLKSIIPSLGQVVLEGGDSVFSIPVVWPRICLESEVVSQGISIGRIYREHPELFEDEFYRPENLQGALAYLALSRYSQERQSEIYYTIARAIFPGLPFENANDFFYFVDGLGVYDNLFDALLEQSCLERGLGWSKPMFEEVLTSMTKEKDKGRVFDLIDRGLAEGRIVSVDYDSNLLIKEELVNPAMDHGSSIVGSLYICDEPYYILRNSWGEGGCSKIRDRFKFSEESNEIIQSFEDEKKICYDRASSVDDEEERDLLFHQCYKTFLTRKKTLVPFFCDAGGNFIISKNQLEKGIFDGAYIKN